jgi:hypothetical protein
MEKKLKGVAKDLPQFINSGVSSITRQTRNTKREKKGS